ncbi:MAG: hypothetical protein DMG68_08835 [Acidobacteria bacterium]|nr:MAG: hypothetical protein DMG68_08835 [Acidobacteriota bacterium]
MVASATAAPAVPVRVDRTRAGPQAKAPPAAPPVRARVAPAPAVTPATAAAQTPRPPTVATRLTRKEVPRVAARWHS